MRLFVIHGTYCGEAFVLVQFDWMCSFDSVRSKSPALTAHVFYGDICGGQWVRSQCVQTTHPFFRFRALRRTTLWVNITYKYRYKFILCG